MTRSGAASTLPSLEKSSPVLDNLHTTGHDAQQQQTGIAMQSTTLRSRIRIVARVAVAVLLLAAADVASSGPPGGRTETAQADVPRLPNVLFISIDDLRNDLGALGIEHARTPNLDGFMGSIRAAKAPSENKLPD